MVHIEFVGKFMIFVQNFICLATTVH